MVLSLMLPRSYWTIGLFTEFWNECPEIPMSMLSLSRLLRHIGVSPGQLWLVLSCFYFSLFSSSFAFADYLYQVSPSLRLSAVVKKSLLFSAGL